MRVWPKKILAKGIVWIFWKVLGDGGIYTKEGSNVRHLPNHSKEYQENACFVDKEDFETGRAKPTK